MENKIKRTSIFNKFFKLISFYKIKIAVLALILLVVCLCFFICNKFILKNQNNVIVSDGLNISINHSTKFRSPDNKNYLVINLTISGTKECENLDNSICLFERNKFYLSNNRKELISENPIKIEESQDKILWIVPFPTISAYSPIKKNGKNIGNIVFELKDPTQTYLYYQGNEKSKDQYKYINLEKFTKDFSYFDFSSIFNSNVSQNKTTTQQKVVVESIEDENIFFTKKMFNPTKNFIDKYPYPNEILVKNDTELSGLFCYKQYIFGYPVGEEKYAISRQYKDTNLNSILFVEYLEDQFLLDFIANKQKEGVNIVSIQKCISEDNLNIIKYESPAGGGGGANKVGVSLVDAKGNLINTININEIGGPFFTCSLPLFFTKDKILYQSCGAGDGAFVRRIIFAIDFNTGTYKTVYDCSTDFEKIEQNVQTQNSTPIICK